MLKHASKKKTWRVSESFDKLDVIDQISRELHLSYAVSRLLANRGYTSVESARSFIKKETEFLYDPFLLADMDKAVSRIIAAIDANEKIVIYGDYDVDGVTAVTVVYTYLRECGANAKYYIPNRIGEGYGVNMDALRAFSADGYTLMITVDTGITAIDEIAEAEKIGLDTVVTDHHECRAELPLAVAVVNPCRPDCTYPFSDLAGCGVAFKLVCALEMKRHNISMAEATKRAADRFSEFVAIGTIADVMPLVGENRIIVSYGLKLLENTKNLGLASLMRASGLMSTDADGKIIKKKITSSSVGFTIAPRINAAGRISSAEFAVELLLCNDPLRADEIASELCETNRRRQTEENSIIEEAEEKISIQCREDDRVIVLDDDHWHHGIIGIVCSRLTEKYNLPSILISFEHNTGDEPLPSDIGKGSGRSICGLNLFEALEACSCLLTKYGGHELAAGLSIERGKLDEFRSAINEYAANSLGEKELCRVVNIDLKLSPEEITQKLADELYLLEPFGTGNAQPFFEIDRLLITEISALAGGKHTKLILRAPGLSTVYTALMFGTPTSEFEFSLGDAVDIACNLDVNEFRGRRSVQLLVRDIRCTQSEYIPTRDDFAALYLYLKNKVQPVKTSCSKIAEDIGCSCDTVLLMLDVFAELSIINLYRGEHFEITLCQPKGKIPLETSHILSALNRKTL
ncbi:MAG: single-stranded-DNA-specific exonuclease RecJ [Clostridia bacterium]|nr:single-stranded-DNA-specific exonuclease RecJ [Clostridia bacterium]